MEIKSHKDFFAGIMFLVVGLAFAWGATTYNVGTGARMGPGYFPFWLGIILLAIGIIVLLNALRGTADGKEVRISLKSLIVFVAMMGFSLLAGLVGASPNASLAIGTVAGCVLAYYIGQQSMGLILGAVTVFGLMLKGLGLIICVAILVIIAALASHESKRNEIIASIILLSAMAWGTFIYGLKLQMPTWPDTQELGRMFVPAEKKN